MGEERLYLTHCCNLNATLSVGAEFVLNEGIIHKWTLVVQHLCHLRQVTHLVK